MSKNKENIKTKEEFLRLLDEVVFLSNVERSVLQRRILERQVDLIYEDKKK